jgi:hypothetical protein
MPAMDSVWGATHLKRNEVFNDQLKEMFEDELFAQAMVSQISDFGDGDNWKVSSIGELTIDQMSEGVSLPERRPDTGQFVFNINEFVGVKSPFTDRFLEDDFLAPAAIAALPRKMKRAFDEYYETQVLKIHRVQTNDDPNTINGEAHRLVASGNDTGGASQEPDDTLVLADFAYARLALQKANAPLTNLIALVPPSFEFNINLTSTLVDVSFNPKWEGIIETGMGAGDGIRFLRNIYGFDVMVSDYLDTVEVAEANLDIYDGTAPAGAGGAAVGYKACQFMTLADDDSKPYIGAWRRTPKIDSWRDFDVETEYHQLSARFGLNLWRPESLVTIFASDALKTPAQT